MQALYCNYWKLFISYSISVSNINVLNIKLKEKENQQKKICPFFIYLFIILTHPTVSQTNKNSVQQINIM
jgi:hypothetical protein